MILLCYYYIIIILLLLYYYFINKKIKVFFIIELKHREPMVFDQGATAGWRTVWNICNDWDGDCIEAWFLAGASV